MSISTTITWKIIDTIRDKSDGFITEIRYSITGASTKFDPDNGSKTLYHTITGGYLIPDHTRTGDEIVFGKLTESQIIDWVKDALGEDQVAMYEDIIPKHLKGMHDGEIYDDPNKRVPLGNSFSNGLPWQLE